MLNDQWRQCFLGVFIVGLAVGVSACDTATEESEGEQESEQVSIPPQLEPRVEADALPAFRDIPAGPQRKEAFFDYLAPIVNDINREVETRREALLVLEQQLEAGEAPSQEARDWLAEMAEHYRVDADQPEQQVAGLKERIDVIPVSLALSQGALESAWGTSRFAREGNNIFGKWCFTQGCGIVPAQRRADANHEVTSYDDVADAVRDYMHHLNSHPVYEPLRERRAQAREEGRSPEGADLAGGLEKYSAKGEGYIVLLRRMIERDDLAVYDDPDENI